MLPVNQFVTYVKLDTLFSGIISVQ